MAIGIPTIIIPESVENKRVRLFLSKFLKSPSDPISKDSNPRAGEPKIKNTKMNDSTDMLVI